MPIFYFMGANYCRQGNRVAYMAKEHKINLAGTAALENADIPMDIS
jgi:hypothetical protein